MGRYCSDCGDYLDASEFSNNQWRRGDGYSRCRDCVGRPCADCGRLKKSEDYSLNQWRKGEGYSRCDECVNTGCECQICGRYFNNRNNLNMHMQVHRPRNVACPVCGDCRFATGANAVQHVESGYCTGCRGQDNARQQIYDFASGQRKMNQYMTPMLEYDGYGSNQVPDFPYQCQPCGKMFRHLSQLLQHQDQKHNNRMALTNY